MVTDLSVAEDAIAERFRKGLPLQDQRAETKDDLRMEFITDPKSRLDEFCAFYECIRRAKITWLSDRQWLLAACKAGQLVLTSASRNGEPGLHAYLTSGKAAWLQYTAPAQGQGQRLPRAGRARQSLAALERNAGVQEDGNNALRLGGPVRRRIDTGETPESTDSRRTSAGSPCAPTTARYR